MKFIHNTVALSVLLSAVTANAATINYNDFSNLSGLSLNGVTAALNPNTDNVLRLTSSTGQSGSAFSTNAVTLNTDVSFSTAFSFRIPNPSGISDGDGQGADGLTFVVQTVSNTAGGSGGGIGYQGLNRSMAVEFDTWNNGTWDDNNGNHIGINLNGNMDSVAQTSIVNRMNNGNTWFAWVDYNGASDLLEVRWSELANARPLNSMLSYNVDLTSVLQSNQAFVGFTSGTGAAGGSHEILNWQFNDSYRPINTSAVPEANALLMLAAGLGLVGAAAKRRQRKLS